MSISKSRGPETYFLRIQASEISERLAASVSDMAKSVGIQGIGRLDGREFKLMFNVRSGEIDSIQHRMVSTMAGWMDVKIISLERVPHRQFSGFHMAQPRDPHTEIDGKKKHRRGICQDCRLELTDMNNRRFGYPFTECPVCAPHFVLSDDLLDMPDMESVRFCQDCREETKNIDDRRYRFIDNSCPTCGPSLFWQRKGEARWQQSTQETVLQGTDVLRDGGIISVKGKNGVYLLCDAGNEAAIRELRRRKGNLLKPLAVMFAGISEAQQHVEIDEQYAAALLSPMGPIVICPFRTDDARHDLARISVSGILDRLGVMLPHCPLMQILSSLYERPLVVTSANRSGQPMILQPENKSLLWELADAIIDHDRIILVPADEPVIQFTEAGERIMLRSGDHTAALPVNWPELAGERAIVTGALPRGQSVLFLNDNLFTLDHLSDNKVVVKDGQQPSVPEDWIHQLRPKPTVILSELSSKQSHKEQYWSSLLPEAVRLKIQHHEAHFASVLAEHDMLHDTDPILGIVWDRGGLGQDGFEWGSEFMIRRQGSMEQLLSLEYFPGAMAGSTGVESRLAAIGLLKHRLDARRLIGHLFSRDEWRNYERWPMGAKEMNTRSMSRLIDGVSTIIGLAPETREASMLDGLPIIETLARRIQMDVSLPYELPIRNNRIDWRPMIDTIIGDLDSGAGRDMIARRFLTSLAELVAHVANLADVRKVAISGEVFCSPMLVTMIADRLGKDRTLYMHHSLSPTDECIPLGQLAVWAIKRKEGQLMESEGKR